MGLNPQRTPQKRKGFTLLSSTRLGHSLHSAKRLTLGDFPPRDFQTPVLCRGFTLIEMLLVLAISALVLATLVPNFGPAIARAQLTTATRDIVSALRLTRALAISQGQDTTLEIDTNEGTYRVSGRPKTYSLPSDIEVGLFTTSTETLDEGRGRVRFFPDGSATGGRVTLSGSKTQRFIDINWLTGEIKISEPDLSGQ